eukprot:TRINITY_DN93724_c0_g1_i1.p2 TRINITY_DN93724_c0_g1~~TRINITY_DN93724_c0_g1_i1.p2  ORF type:complete len:149 (+),score=7.65 TRINITY_DN93724_c0_g1_i1:45-491(+)
MLVFGWFVVLLCTVLGQVQFTAPSPPPPSPPDQCSVQFCNGNGVCKGNPLDLQSDDDDVCDCRSPFVGRNCRFVRGKFRGYSVLIVVAIILATGFLAWAVNALLGDKEAPPPNRQIPTGAPPMVETRYTPSPPIGGMTTAPPVPVGTI